MPTRLSQSQQALALLYHARSATPFFSQGGEPCASIPGGVDSCRIFPLRSADFRDWLTANYFAEYESAPSDPALRAAVRTLEARAHADSPARNVDRRVGFEGDPYAPSKVFLDLANPDGQLLEITSQGWRITDNLGRSFRQSPAMLPLPPPQSPIPDPGLSLAQLFHLSPIAQTRAMFFLTAALRATGPYPILVLRGPASSGKSTLARALRTLIDPSTAPLHRLPDSNRELLHLAQRNWILLFDHFHRIPVQVSEALCALASGEAIETPQPDCRDPAVAEIARPIILVAPQETAQNSWAPARALSTRSLTIDLAPLAQPRAASAVWSEFEALRAPILATLADAVSTALRNIRDTDVHSMRFPDSALWAAAAAPALGLDPAAMLDAISGAGSMWVGSDPLRDTVFTLLGAHPTWSGDSITLLSRLRSLAPFASLPKSPRSLLEALSRTPGISLARAGRLLTISKTVIQSATFPNP